MLVQPPVRILGFVNFKAVMLISICGKIIDGSQQHPLYGGLSDKN